MFKKKELVKENPMRFNPTILASTLTVFGDMVCSGDIKVDGHITGNINTMGRVIVSETGCVIGDIRATRIIVKGSVQGKLECAGRLTLDASAKVNGGISYNEVEIEHGADFIGNLTRVNLEKTKTIIEHKIASFKEKNKGAIGLQVIKNSVIPSVKHSKIGEENLVDGESNLEKIGWV